MRMIIFALLLAISYAQTVHQRQTMQHAKYPLYRWNEFNIHSTYEGWLVEDDPTLFAGSQPSQWNAGDGVIPLSHDVDSYRALFTRNGPLVHLENPGLGNLQAYTTSDYAQGNANQAHILVMLFRMWNANEETTNWNWSYYHSSNNGWSQNSQIIVNGEAIWIAATDNSDAQVDTTLELQPGMNSIVVIVHASPENGNRLLSMGWKDSTMIPPTGVFFHDDLFDESDLTDMTVPDMRVPYFYVPGFSERPAERRKPQFPLYRWTHFDTYTHGTGNWYAGNDASLFGQIAPSSWTDGNAVASSLSSNVDKLRAFFTKDGPMVTEDTVMKNALVFSSVWTYHSSTNGRVVLTLFRIMNELDEPVTWTVKPRITAYAGWSESGAITVNGEDIWVATGSNYNTDTVIEQDLEIRPGMNTVIFQSTSAYATSSRRVAFQGFLGDCLNLPDGLSFKDDLYDGEGTDNLFTSTELRRDMDNINQAATYTNYFPLYRWTHFATYSYNNGWAFENDQAMLGGIPASTWGDGNGVTAGMDFNNKAMMRSLFNRNGPMVKNGANFPGNMMVHSHEWKSYSSTDSQHVASYWSIYNSESYPIAWTFNFFNTEYAGWSELGSIMVNGEQVFTWGTSVGPEDANSDTVTLTPGENWMIMICASGPSSNTRAVFQAFRAESLHNLPSGVFFFDSLYDEATKYPSLVPSFSPSITPSQTCPSNCCYCDADDEECEYTECDEYICYSTTSDGCRFNCDHTGFICSPSYRGVQNDISVHRMVRWNTIIDVPYSTPTDHREVAVDADGLGECVLVGARHSDDDETFFRIAAFGRTEYALMETQSTSDANYDRNVFWYNVPGKSFGFASMPQISLQPMDILLSDSDDERLSWVLDSNEGGYRAGLSIDLEDSSDWHKVLMSGPCEDVQVSPTKAPTVSDGVKYDFQLVSAGWELIYDAPYSDPTTSDDLFGHDNMGECILMGVREGGNPHLMVAAVANTADISEDTGSDTVAIESRGVYWYNRPGNAIGFSASSNIDLRPHDVLSPRDDPSRVSWHLDSGIGGWRAGTNTNLNDNEDYHKVFYTGSCDMQTGVPTESPTNLFTIYYDYMWPNYMGWRTTYDELYTHPTTTSDITDDLDECILVGAKMVDSDTFELAAFGYSDRVTATTDSMTTAYIDHGTYWYFYPGYSMGFAANWNIDITNGGDVTNEQGGGDRLSWNLDTGTGGQRAGTTLNLDGEEGNNWRKVVMTGPCDLITSEPTVTPSIHPATSPSTGPTKTPSKSPLTLATFEEVNDYIYAMTPTSCDVYDHYQPILTSNRCTHVFDTMKEGNFIDFKKDVFMPTVDSITPDTMPGCTYNVASKTLMHNGHYEFKSLESNGENFSFCERFAGVSDECADASTGMLYYSEPVDGRCMDGRTMCTLTRMGRSPMDLCFPTECVDEDKFEEYINFRERYQFWTMAEPFYGSTVTCGEMSATDLMKQVIDQLYRSTCSN